MKRKIFAIDLDDTLNNLVNVWVQKYNDEYQDNLDMNIITSWDIASYTKIGKDFYKYLKEPGFFQSLDIQLHAKEVTEWLSQYFDLYIVTAFRPYACVDKVEWVKKFLPHIPHDDNVIFCNPKGMIHADFLLDDGLHNLKAFKATNRYGTPIIFDKPWNQEKTKMLRVTDWLELQETIKELMYWEG